MNPIDQYRDSSLDGLIESRQASNRKTSRNRHSRGGSSATQEPYDLANAPDVPNAPTITYPGADGAGKQGLQRSFSQRARGRPYADEAFLDDGAPDAQDQPVQRQSATHYDPPQDLQPSVSPASRDKENVAHRQQLIQDNIKSAAGSVRSPKDHGDQARLPPSSAYDDVGADTGMTRAPVAQDHSLSTDQRDWAPDRSPLQKLEVTLNDISKEEKRARVQEAEMLHRKTASQRSSEPGSHSTRRSQPSDRSSHSTRKTQPSTISHPSTIEDAGMVRSLSNTHRDRLQHSTTIESHKPDATRLSMDRPPGQTFDYHSYFPPNRSVTITRRGKPIVSPENVDTRRSVSASHTQPLAGRVASQSRSVSATQPSQATDSHHSSVPVSQQTRQSALNDLNRQPTSNERNASRRAALDQLTGSSSTPRSKSGSRRVPPETDAGFQPVRQASTSSRGARSSLDHDRAIQGGDDAPSSVYPSSAVPGGLGQHPPSALPVSDAAGMNAQSIPGSKRRSSVSFKEPYDRRRPVDEWKAAETAHLSADDFLMEPREDFSQNKAWWEQDAKSRRRSSRAQAAAATENLAIDDRIAEFQPRLYLRCGPLLRYTGMKRTVGEGAKEYWRGTVMIVTSDSQSSYETPPTLRLFSQPKSLFTPSQQVSEGEELPTNHRDPIAGTTKLSRIGRALYVRPAESLPESHDLSFDETDDGLFQSSPPIATGGEESVSVTPLVSRNSDSNGERFGRHKEIKGVRLYADPERDVTFWLFKLEVQLSPEQQHIGYRINKGAASGFWVPAEGQTMNIMFHSCNGFSLSVTPDNFSGPDPLWRDVLNAHQSRPFHVMIGGGDQIYNDKIMNQTHYFKEWTANKNAHYKHHAPFTTEMKEELETFYLNNYSTWFSQGMFAVAGSQIPMVNMWDDHDIIDGFGSYPHAFQLSPVFSGIGNIAFKYYMLFQQHSVDAITQADEPSWLLGYKPGPYIKQLSRSIFVNLGRSVAFLALDCRTERMKNQVLSLDTCDMALERCRKEITEGETKHLVVLLGVPIAYPRMNWLENVLTSRAMDPVKAMGRAGVLKGGFLNRFDGGVEVLDDLDDHWTAHHHKEERNEFIKELQDLAAERSVRITILGGDVHLCAIGQFYSNPKLKIPKDRDHRYMPNVISSAIVNTPPPEMLADVLNKRNKVHHLDQYTDESMIPMFTHDTNLKKRNNRHLLPRRNWCSITTYRPGRTPPSSRSSSPGRSEFSEPVEQEVNITQPKRRFSLSRDDVNPRMLFRRISSRNAPPTAYREGGDSRDEQRAASFDRVRSNHSGQDTSTGKLHRRATSETRGSNTNQDYASDAPFDSRQPPPLRPGFHRRPTNLSEKAAKKGNVPAVDADGNEFDVNDHVNLEGGLDIVLHCEVDQHDPSGATEPYRLLVPALWYDGSSDREKLDANEAGGIQRKPTLLNKMGIGGRRGQKAAQNQGAGNWGQEMSDTESYSSGSEEVTTESRDRPPKKKFGLFGSLKKKRADDEYYDEHDMYEQGQSRPSVPPQAAPVTNREAALGQRSIHDQVTSPTVAAINSGSLHARSQADSGTLDRAYDGPTEASQPSGASFNRPPGQSREVYDNTPPRNSSFRGANVLRKKSQRQGGPSERATMGPANTNQHYTGRNSNDYGQPSTPTRQDPYTIGSNRSTGSQNKGFQAPGTSSYDPDSTYVSSHDPSQAQGQNRVTRILSQPTNVGTSVNPPSSFPRQDPVPGAPTDQATLSNPRQRSLRGNGILGRFTSRRTASADQVPTAPAPQATEDFDDNFKPPPPQRTTSGGYTGIEAYREKPKRGLSFKDRTRNFLDRIDGRKQDNDDGSDGYSYTSSESYSSAGLGEVDDHDHNQNQDHVRGQGQGHGHGQPQNQVPERRSNEQQRRVEEDPNSSYLDEPYQPAERPGMARGLSQKIRLNMMRMGSMGGKGGRTKSSAGAGANEGKDGSYY